MFKVNAREFLKGAFVAVGGAVFAYLAVLVKAPGFDFHSIPWDEILRISVSTFMGYITTKFFTDSEGKVFGKV